MNNLEKLVEELLERQVGGISVVLGYFEHQVDLLTKVVKDLYEIVDKEKITPEMQERLGHIDSLLEQSSIDFENINHPLESYKLPGAVEKKAIIRDIQSKYLNTKINKSN